MGVSVPSFATSKAPTPSAPTKLRSSAGHTMTPSVARPCSARPIITANSPFLAMNSRVPSSGSTNHTAGAPAQPANVPGSLSSATMGRPGNARSSAAHRMAFAFLSAIVTGSSLPLYSTSTVPVA